jgi:hypothetical protein
MELFRRHSGITRQVGPPRHAKRGEGVGGEGRSSGPGTRARSSRGCWHATTERRRARLVAVAAILLLLAIGCAPSKTREAIDQLREQPLDPDIEQLRKTDPKLVTYKEVARIATGFENPRGVAVGVGGVYVAGDRAVAQFDFNGKRKGLQALPAEPQCLAVDPNGKAYVAADDRVMVVDGSHVQSWPSYGPKAVFSSIVVGPAGAWVADAGNRVVVRYALDGRVVGTLGKRDPKTNYPGLIVPSPHLDVALDSLGNLVVTNPGTHRVETHSPDGNLLSAWGKESMEIDGFCGCCNPTDIALLADNSVVTAEKGLLRVKRYSTKGEFVGVVAGAESFNETISSLDLAVFQDRVYVLDPFDKVVRVYASKSGGKP